MSITWAEFKKIVQDAGAQDDTPVFYIDTGNCPHADRLTVGINDLGIAVNG